MQLPGGRLKLEINNFQNAYPLNLLNTTILLKTFEAVRGFLITKVWCDIQHSVRKTLQKEKAPTL